ncbi:hypothetical protein H4R18_002283 [Coemansia javaensis]|uniref:F-box domain-containing protein n=1 Tax=Coemansia javaensis TaxID=2761396 RepID=A0A9W8HB86_9FUNG|nr:hypothetical protein H4R18_002283 [Coemansia javaensis]
MQASEDVMLGVLRHVAPDAGGDARGWRAALALLGVCRRWRALLAPAVYRHAHVGRASNAALVESGGMGGCVRTVTAAQGPGDESLVRDVARQLPPAGWPRATLLRVRARFASPAWRAPPDAPDPRAAAAQCVRLLPALAGLDVVARRPDAATAAFLAALLPRCAARLRRLAWAGALPPAEPALPAPRIAHLALPASDPARLPAVDPRRLQSLALHNVGPAFAWGAFRLAGRALRFECLTSLALSNVGLDRASATAAAAAAATAGWPPLDGAFPCLERLALEGACLDPRALPALLRPPLRRLRIAWWAVDLRRAGVAPLGFLRSLELHHDLAAAATTDLHGFHCAASSALALARGVPSVRMCLYALDSAALADLPARVCWPSLTALELHLPLDLRTAARLLRAAPDLRILVLPQLLPACCVDGGLPEDPVAAARHTLGRHAPALVRIDIALAARHATRSHTPLGAEP